MIVINRPWRAPSAAVNWRKEGGSNLFCDKFQRQAPGFGIIIMRLRNAIQIFCSHINEPVVVKGEQKRQIIIGDRERKNIVIAADI
jgi:hypothetical protein